MNIFIRWLRCLIANFDANELGRIVANAVLAFLSSPASLQAVASTINTQSCNSRVSSSSHLSVTVSPSTRQASQNTTQVSGQVNGYKTYITRGISVSVTSRLLLGNLNKP